MWSQLKRSGIEYSFACVFLVALNDIEKQILAKSDTASAAADIDGDKKRTAATSDAGAAGTNTKSDTVEAASGSSRGKGVAGGKSGGRGLAAAFAKGIPAVRGDGNEEVLIMGVSVVTPELNVRAQLAPEIHFLEEEPSFYLLAQLLDTLGLVLKSSPDDFTFLVADSDVMPILQTVFRCVFFECIFVYSDVRNVHHN